MSDNWEVGDLALCVSDTVTRGFKPSWCPKIGGVYTVAHYYESGGEGFLELQEDPEKFDPRGAWEPLDFRKIRPHTPDAEDRETIALLTGKPVGVPA